MWGFVFSGVAGLTDYWLSLRVVDPEPSRRALCSTLYAILFPGHGALSFAGFAMALKVEFEITNCDLKLDRSQIATASTVTGDTGS